MILLRSFFLLVVMSRSEALRVLLLHGKGSSGPEMLSRFEKIGAALGKNVEFVAPTSPLAQPEWWALPPGHRSFTATEYLDFDQSVAFLRDFMPVDVAWGHSDCRRPSKVVALPPPPRKGDKLD
mmetsp:Transcript_29027/g.93604  ORF Transcript_29027/g.93604 Transcript_29027/m.93604 type:complete len:124 (-) Transcript_29027:652-1023(-)